MLWHCELWDHPYFILQMHSAGLMLGSWSSLGLSLSFVKQGTHLRRALVMRNHLGLSCLSQACTCETSLPALPVFTTSLCHRNANSSSESGSGCYLKGTILARSIAVLTNKPLERKMQYTFFQKEIYAFMCE